MKNRFVAAGGDERDLKLIRKLLAPSPSPSSPLCSVKPHDGTMESQEKIPIHSPLPWFNNGCGVFPEQLN